MRFVVAGGGVAGLATALSVARAGDSAVVIERDEVEPQASPEGAFAVARRGIPHLLQPHTFLPRGRRILRHSAPDVLDTLLDAGRATSSSRRSVSSETDATGPRPIAPR